MRDYIDSDGDECELVIKTVAKIHNWDEMSKSEQCKVYCSKIICKTNPCKKYKMAKKRFTFADAKERIKELEEQVEDLQGILKDEFENAKDDIIEDVSSFGYGDIAIAVAGIGVGLLLGYLLF